MPGKYGDVIISMTIIRRFECVLDETKNKVVKIYKEEPNYPAQAIQKITERQFYNTSEYDLERLCNEPDRLASNFKAYLEGLSQNEDFFALLLNNPEAKDAVLRFFM